MSTAVRRHSVDDQRRSRLETALRDRDEELRELRQTMDSNERALLRSLDDERRRWAADRQRLQAELLSARRYGLPALRSAFRCPSADQALPGDRIQTAAVVVVEPSQRPPPTTSETAATSWSTAGTRLGKSENHCDTMTSSDTSLPVEIAGGNISSGACKNDFEMDRKSTRTDFDVAEKLRLELELCRREFADERRRWVDEKRVVVEYQLRLQSYCRQLADRNQLLEERLKSTGLELGQNGGSSGYSSDSAALRVQFHDDSSLLTSSL